MSNPVLIIMAKEPRVGRTKTRLCPPLTPTQAAQLYEALLKDSIAFAASLSGLDLAIAVTPPEATSYFDCITPPGTLLLPVDCTDIGDCLIQVLSSLLASGYPKVLAFNTDGPTLPPDYVHTAVQLLDEHDVVLGPSEDGGYYLVGLKQLHAEIFTDIAWSTSLVLTQTLDKLARLQLKVMMLPPWYDIDTAADLVRLQAELAELTPDKLIHTRRFLAGYAPADR